MDLHKNPSRNYEILSKSLSFTYNLVQSNIKSILNI